MVQMAAIFGRPVAAPVVLAVLAAKGAAASTFLLVIMLVKA